MFCLKNRSPGVAARGDSVPCLAQLETQGRAVTEESAVDDMEFLMEIMEVNESIEHLTGSEQHEEMKELMAQIKGASESYIQDAEAAFSAGDLDAAFAAIVRLRYYDNCKVCTCTFPIDPELGHPADQFNGGVYKGV
eukprot:m.966401 g.966401  ORF g.966401 m.966401 type:complete len:137 (-) comp23912_c0_seq43:2808-3218(-)